MIEMAFIDGVLFFPRRHTFDGSAKCVCKLDWKLLLGFGMERLKGLRVERFLSKTTSCDFGNRFWHSGGDRTFDVMTNEFLERRNFMNACYDYRKIAKMRNLDLQNGYYRRIWQSSHNTGPNVRCIKLCKSLPSFPARLATHNIYRSWLSSSYAKPPFRFAPFITLFNVQPHLAPLVRLWNTNWLSHRSFCWRYLESDLRLANTLALPIEALKIASKREFTNIWECSQPAKCWARNCAPLFGELFNWIQPALELWRSEISPPLVRAKQRAGNMIRKTKFAGPQYSGYNKLPLGARHSGFELGSGGIQWVKWMKLWHQACSSII